MNLHSTIETKHLWLYFGKPQLFYLQIWFELIHMFLDVRLTVNIYIVAVVKALFLNKTQATKSKQADWYV